MFSDRSFTDLKSGFLPVYSSSNIPVVRYDLGEFCQVRAGGDLSHRYNNPYRIDRYMVEVKPPCAIGHDGRYYIFSSRQAAHQTVENIFHMAREGSDSSPANMNINDALAFVYACRRLDDIQRMAMLIVQKTGQDVSKTTFNQLSSEQQILFWEGLASGNGFENKSHLTFEYK